MKPIKILASAFVLFALSVNAFATDTPDNLPHIIENNKQDIATVSIRSGRNKGLESTYAKVAHQLLTSAKNDVILKAIPPKGRNLEGLDYKEDSTSSYANTGRNNKIVNEIISMN